MTVERTHDYYPVVLVSIANSVGVKCFPIVSIDTNSFLLHTVVAVSASSISARKALTMSVTIRETIGQSAQLHPAVQ